MLPACTQVVGGGWCLAALQLYSRTATYMYSCSLQLCSRGRPLARWGPLVALAS
jgi:hypothetical protein